MDSVERLLGFVPTCLKVFDAQGQQRLGLFADTYKGRVCCNEPPFNSF